MRVPGTELVWQPDMDGSPQLKVVSKLNCTALCLFPDETYRDNTSYWQITAGEDLCFAVSKTTVIELYAEDRDRSEFGWGYLFRLSVKARLVVDDIVKEMER